MSAELDIKEKVEQKARPAVLLTEEEKARLATVAITEEDVAEDPTLRFAGIFADDPDFMPIMRRVFREGRGREMPE